MTKQDLDIQLLRILESDGRASISALASRLRVSRSTVRSRMEKLEEEGTIQGYTVRYSDGRERKRVRAHVMLNIDTAATSVSVERSLRKLMEVRTLHSIAGDFDLLAVVEADNTTILDSALDAVRDIDGVARTHTVIILATRFGGKSRS